MKFVPVVNNFLFVHFCQLQGSFYVTGFHPFIGNQRNIRKHLDFYPAVAVHNMHMYRQVLFGIEIEAQAEYVKQSGHNYGICFSFAGAKVMLFSELCKRKHKKLTRKVSFLCKRSA